MSKKEELAIKARNGDQESLNEVIEVVRKKATIMAMSLAPGRTADQDELVADSISRTTEILAKWNPDKSKFTSFSEMCIKNYQVNTLVRLSRNNQVPIHTVSEDELAIEADDGIDFDDLEGSSEVADAALATIHTMSPSQKKIILMVMQGKSIQEIANEYGIRHIEAKARLRAAVNYIMFEIKLKHPDQAAALEEGFQ